MLSTKSLGLALLVLLFLSLSLICGIMAFARPSTDFDSTSWLLMGVLVGLLGTGGSVTALLRLAEEWQESLRQKFAEKSPDHLASWSVPIDHWRAFARAERGREVKEHLQIAAIVGAVVGGIFAVLTWSGLGFFKALGVGLGIAGGIGLLVGGIGWWVIAHRFAWRAQQQEVLVSIHRDGILVNRRVISWSHLGSELTAIRFDSQGDEGRGVLIASTQTFSASSHTPHTHEYRIPVPSTAASQAQALVIELGGVIDGESEWEDDDVDSSSPVLKDRGGDGA